MYKIRWIINLIFILLLLFILIDLEVAKLIALLGVGHHTQPVTEVVFLQILLGQILQVSARQQMKTVLKVQATSTQRHYIISKANNLRPPNWVPYQNISVWINTPQNTSHGHSCTSKGVNRKLAVQGVLGVGNCWCQCHWWSLETTKGAASSWRGSVGWAGLVWILHLVALRCMSVPLPVSLNYPITYSLKVILTKREWGHTGSGTLAWDETLWVSVISFVHMFTAA